MVGVGSGSALNAFNIGQQATQPTAVGMAIKSIVDNADKQGLLQAQSGAQAAGSLATAQYKNQLDTAPQDVVVQNPDGSFTTIKGAPGGKASILGAPQQTNIGQAVGGMLAEPRPNKTFNFGDIGAGAPSAPAAAPGAGGANPFEGIDPNAELTQEQEAAIRAALGLQ